MGAIIALWILAIFFLLVAFAVEGYQYRNVEARRQEREDEAYWLKKENDPDRYTYKPQIYPPPAPRRVMRD